MNIFGQKEKKIFKSIGGQNLQIEGRGEENLRIKGCYWSKREENLQIEGKREEKLQFNRNVWSKREENLQIEGTEKKSFNSRTFFVKKSRKPSNQENKIRKASIQEHF